MDNATRDALKWARRRFAATYYFVEKGVGTISGGEIPIMPVTVTDSGSNPDAPAYGCPAGEAAILVLWRRPTASEGESVLTFPRTFEGFPVRYAELTFEAKA